MRNRVITVSVIFYVAVAALLLGVLFQEWVNVLPKSLATRIGHNSEGYLIVLAVAPWIQFARPRLIGKRAEWPVTILVALAFVGLTVVMLTTDWPSRFKTLNEGTAGAALMIPYVQLRRPFPKRVAMWTTIALIVITAVTIKTAETIDLAETFGMVILGVVGLDIIDRGILDPTAVTSAAKRWSWYAFLVVAPVVFSVWEYHLDAGTAGIVGTSVRWLVRIVEAFIFALFTQGFFAVGLGRTGGAAEPAQAELPDPVAPIPAPVG